MLCQCFPVVLPVEYQYKDYTKATERLYMQLYWKMGLVCYKTLSFCADPDKWTNSFIIFFHTNIVR